MIIVEKHAIGFTLAFYTEWIGSSLPKALPMALLSLLIHLGIDFFLPEVKDYFVDQIEHPYAIGVIVTGITFLVVFRANSAYQRYALGAEALFHVSSKAMDSCTQCKAFHAQRPDAPAGNSHEEDIDPFLQDLFHLHSLLLAICCLSLRKDDNLENIIAFDNSDFNDTELSMHYHRRSSTALPYKKGPGGAPSFNKAPKSTLSFPSFQKFVKPKKHSPVSTTETEEKQKQKEEEGGGGEKGVKLKVKSDGKNVNDDHRPESIFGKFLYGVSMRASTDQRLRYNANNPFPVYGGLLEEEHVILNKCKSMNSKVHLVIYWLNEFIARASKTDMLGGIGQPIISRVFQELSDANLAYERARRIAVIQFPFVLQQMSEIFVLFLVPLVPILNLSKVGDPILSAVLTFFSVLCFLGLYEAARDVEDPYMYEPNDLPMVEICHEFCMALVAMTVHPRAPGGKSDSSTKPAVSGNIVMW